MVFDANRGACGVDAEPIDQLLSGVLSEVYVLWLVTVVRTRGAERVAVGPKSGV